MAAALRASPVPAWPRIPGPLLACLVAAGTFAAQSLSTLLRYPTINVSPMWVPMGFVTGFLIASPRRTWPWSLAGAFLGVEASYFQLNDPILVVLALGALSVPAAGFTALLVQRSSPPNGITRRSLVALVAGIPISWLFLVLPLSTLIALARPELSFAQFLVWNTGSAAAVIFLAVPAFATLTRFAAQPPRVSAARAAEATARWLLLVISALAAFWFNSGADRLQALQFLPLPILLWSATRFRVPGVSVDLFTLALIAFFAAAHGAGPLGAVASETRMFIMQLTLAALGLPMLFLAAVVAERVAAEQRLGTQLRFGEVVAEIATSLAGAQPATLHSLMVAALQHMGEFLDADRVVLGEIDAATGDLIGRWHYRRTEPPVPPRLAISQRYPWMWDELRAGRTVRIPDVEALPPEAATDQTNFRAVGIREQLAIPLLADGRVCCVLAVANVSRNDALPPEVEPRLRVLAGILATAVQRCAAEDILRLTQYAVDQNPAIIFRIDASGRFQYANEAASRQLGYAPADLLRLHIWDISSTTTEAGWPLRAAEITARGSVQFESIFTCRQGRPIPVEMRTAFLHRAAGDSFFTFAFDISARRAAQEAAHQHLRRLRALATQMTHGEERQRRELAALLHDKVGQNLFAATTRLLTLKSAASPEGAATTVDRVLALLDQVTRDTRELTYELCPPALYELGLAAALQRLAEEFSKRFGIACTVEGSGPGPEDLNIRGTAYHAVRELLNNVAKHAHATQVTVRLSQDAGMARIEVIDNGRGCPPEESGRATGFGLFNLRERAGLLGGSLAMTSVSGGGCRVVVTLPPNATAEGA